MPTTPLYSYVHCELTGKVMASRMEGYGHDWEWLSGAVAEWCDCRPSDVDLVETLDGDALTAHGEIVARIRLG